MTTLVGGTSKECGVSFSLNEWFQFRVFGMEKSLKESTFSRMNLKRRKFKLARFQCGYRTPYKKFKKTLIDGAYIFYISMVYVMKHILVVYNYISSII